MIMNIAKDLLPLARPINSLRLDPLNARKHEDRSLESIRASLRRFGQMKPIVALEDGTVIAGNGTLTAAAQEGWDSIAVVTFPDKDSARAYALADNRTAELSSWDDKVLADSLASMQSTGEDFSNIGFTMEEALEAMGKLQVPIAVSGPDVELDERPRGPTEDMRASHVRMVQLFFNEETQPIFLERIQKIAKRYDTDNVTDTVAKAVEEASER